MKARTTILTAVTALALSGTATATIPSDGGSFGPKVGRTTQSATGCVPAAKTPERSLAVIRPGYDWSKYVHSFGPAVRDVQRDAFDRRTVATALTQRDESYHPGAYVHGGASTEVAKAIQAAGKQQAAPVRGVQWAKRPEFRYPR